MWYVTNVTEYFTNIIWHIANVIKYFTNMIQNH